MTHEDERIKVLEAENHSLHVTNAGAAEEIARLRAENAALRDKVARLCAPASDEEWWTYAAPSSKGTIDLVYPWGVDALIAARAAEPKSPKQIADDCQEIGRVFAERMPIVRELRRELAEMSEQLAEERKSRL